MTIKRHFEHSFDESLIVPGGWGADFGCGSDFFISNFLLSTGLRVLAVDPNPAILAEHVPISDMLHFENVALTTADVDSIDMIIYNDQDAASCVKMKDDIGYIKRIRSQTVNASTITKLMKKYQIEKFEVLKLDIEGAEYDFLMSINFPIAKQISVEFHDFRGSNPYYPDNEKYYKELFEHFSSMYDITRHVIEKHPGLDGEKAYNYWDSLFVEKQ